MCASSADPGTSARRTPAGPRPAFVLHARSAGDGRCSRLRSRRSRRERPADRGRWWPGRPPAAMLPPQCCWSWPSPVVAPRVGARGSTASTDRTADVTDPPAASRWCRRVRRRLGPHAVGGAAPVDQPGTHRATPACRRCGRASRPRPTGDPAAAEAPPAVRGRAAAADPGAPVLIHAPSSTATTSASTSPTASRRSGGTGARPQATGRSCRSATARWCARGATSCCSPPARCWRHCSSTTTSGCRPRSGSTPPTACRRARPVLPALSPAPGRLVAGPHPRP